MSFFDYLPGSGYVCAHRGARSIAPENTLMALAEARRCGADLWEADVQMTSDGELVIFHDDRVTRTTNIAGHAEFRERKPWYVADFTLAELATLDHGSWFIQSDPFGTIATGEVKKDQFASIRAQKISPLIDVLLYCRQYDFPFNLEIKDQHAKVSSETVVAAVLDQLKAAGMEELTLVSSFNHDYLRQVKKQSPAIATAALVEKTHPAALVAYLQDLEVCAYHPDWQITDSDLIQTLNQVSIRTNLWTVNDVDKAREFSAAGAAFICTDWPQRLVSERH